MKIFIRKQISLHRQLFRYAIIGSSCAFLDFLIYTLLVRVAHIPYLYSNMISVHCGIFASFLLNRHFTFKVKNKVFLRFLAFYLIGMTGLVVSSALLVLFIEKLLIDKMMAKVITIVVVASIQYLLNKHISFNHGIKR